MRLRLLSLILLSAALAGCATKHYGRQGTITNHEKTTLTCREIALELAKTDGFINQVHTESQFDTRSVLSFLGDWGIGNVMERNAALKSAKERKASLEALSERGHCDSQAAGQGNVDPK